MIEFFTFKGLSDNSIPISLLTIVIITVFSPHRYPLTPKIIVVEDKLWVKIVFSRIIFVPKTSSY